ncbi:hypothetical protein [Nocardioides sp. Root190]|uniref:hypothetical protein n=1 Tax=Nocardioides sp. Root190 TaxID=1736488 RepID=UPI0012F75B7E|nr:hypothetical protein [Nocardioides sp. Root190]
MFFWFETPESGAGWVLWSALLAVQLWAVIIVIRDVRGSKLNAWHIAALAFLVIAGPGGTLMFLLAHGLLERRDRRKAQAAAAASL